jgi:glycosyltransferase involved in cell wall biosynthesis
VNQLNPLVSAIIPVHNVDRYLGEAIESVLAQTYSNIELIVIDDGSTDASAIVAQSYGDRVNYLYQSNAGVSAAQNAGVKRAKGDLVAFLDSDDTWSAGKILDMVFTHVEQFRSPELPADVPCGVPPGQEIMAGLATGTMLTRVEAFDRVGLFSSGFVIGDFIDWFARAVDAGVTHEILPDVLMRRRIHDRNMGISNRDHRSDYLQVLKAAIDRRRQLAKGRPA